MGETRMKVPARSHPLPTSISREAREALAAMLSAEGFAESKLGPAPAQDDIAGWIAYREHGDAWLGGKLAEVVPVSSIETTEIEGVTVHIGTPPHMPDDGAVFLDLHGGGMILGSGPLARLEAGLYADMTGALTCSVDYRVPPETRYPGPLDDCVAVYRALVHRHGADRIVVGGLSAGGNLAAALVLRARDEGLPLPAGLVLLTPENDLTESGDSFETLAGVDLILPERLMPLNLLYAGGHDLAHPYLSPLFGDFAKGFPRTFLQCGTRDLFLSNTVRMHRALRRAGIPCELHVFEGMPHGGFGGAPEDFELAAEVRRFANECWGRPID
ncbi:alpha/beta hydrolase [Croceicoccus sp. BE223]|uniref:alpha/beta hydrolase n=1 Tax=Croceicoccus sp. BE223 TaxID=2817716 RepID=UPI00285DF318|nr:alpha/beta hydrolase [Croceicoccus sp. BE223]MDR7103265.1 acetyl esterase/lipase [Croceicoccus sp. BE223]